MGGRGGRGRGRGGRGGRIGTSSRGHSVAASGDSSSQGGRSRSRGTSRNANKENNISPGLPTELSAPQNVAPQRKRTIRATRRIDPGRLNSESRTWNQLMETSNHSIELVQHFRPGNVQPNTTATSNHSEGSEEGDDEMEELRQQQGIDSGDEDFIDLSESRARSSRPSTLQSGTASASTIQDTAPSVPQVSDIQPDWSFRFFPLLSHSFMSCILYP